ncbi:hypothetical protein PSTT_04580 [Puccinia striiformis]|uniref:Uncharacterized protein n=1 Tax=Puccinia striiformis TaxID=27350 RepID=A0A2S4VS18_9BASI|nr:hypothetical protein PSTT_04580 [Puccinia striiformis]
MIQLYGASMRAFAVQRIASRGFVCSLGSGMRGPGLFGRNTGRCGLARIEIGSCHVIQDYKECERSTFCHAQVVLRYKTQLVHQPRVSRRNITSNPPQHIHPHSKRRFDSCLTHATMKYPATARLVAVLLGIAVAQLAATSCPRYSCGSNSVTATRRLQTTCDETITCPFDRSHGRCIEQIVVTYYTCNACHHPYEEHNCPLGLHELINCGHGDLEFSSHGTTWHQKLHS